MINDNKHLLLIDGSSMLATCFFASLPREMMYAKTIEEKALHYHKIMHSRSGRYTNALYGFFRTLFKVLSEQKPMYIAVAWDLTRDTFRRQLSPEYKANRDEVIEPMKEQFDSCRELLDKIGVREFADNNYEADDLCGSLTKLFEDEIPIRILTKDHDYLQLASERTHIWMVQPSIERSLELFEKYQINPAQTNLPDRVFPFTPQSVKGEYNVEPSGIISLKALQGDASDNIKGVKGIGEETAKALIGHYGSVEALYADIEGLDADGLKQKAAYYKEHLGLKRSPFKYLLAKPESEEDAVCGKEAALLSKQLATIICDVPFEGLRLEDLRTNVDYSAARTELEALDIRKISYPRGEWEQAEANPFAVETPFGDNPFE
jgi:DNA polymerase-1